MTTKVAVVPAGQWGTALAVPLLRALYRVALWNRDPDFAADFNRSHRSPYLPGQDLPAGLVAVRDLAEALDGAAAVVLAPAAAGLRPTLRRLAPLLAPGTLLICCTKGLEPGTQLRASQVIAAELPAYAGHVAVLSGPSFAVEVAKELPTAVVVAAADPAVARAAQDLLMTRRLRVYTNEDVVGVELGGALKNVFAIGVGISDGLGMGLNARAALITRGAMEMAKVGVSLGANVLTFAGISGIGDLVLTCTGDLSRNRRCGLALGGGESLEHFLERTGLTVEGVPTTEAAWQLARRLGVPTPITEQIHRVLFEGMSAREGMEILMAREKASELDPRLLSGAE